MFVFLNTGVGHIQLDLHTGPHVLCLHVTVSCYSNGNLSFQPSRLFSFQLSVCGVKCSRENKQKKSAHGMAGERALALLVLDA